jgi:hypothetical protein
MIESTPIPPAARIAAKLRFRERRTLILTVAMIVSSAVLVFLFPHRPAPPRARSRAERNQLLGSGTCIVQESNGALIGKLIGRSPPYLGRAYHPPTYLIEDPRVRTRRTVEVWGTRRVPCSSIHEP